MNIPDEYRGDIDTAVSILMKYSPEKVFLFGSITNGAVHKYSDIDIAVKGIKSEDFFLALGELQGLMDHSFDIVNLDFKDKFTEYLLSSGSLVHVA